MISYKPLFKLMIDKNINKTKLKDILNCSPATITKMGKDLPISLSMLDVLCSYFHCRIEDLIEHYEK